MFGVVPYFLFLVSCLFVVGCWVFGVWCSVLGFGFGVLVFWCMLFVVFVACRCWLVIICSLLIVAWGSLLGVRC